MVDPAEIFSNEPPRLAIDANTVAKVEVKGKPKRRRFSYFEQELTEASTTNVWDQMLSKPVGTFNNVILGVLKKNKLLWSDDAPNHYVLWYPDSDEPIGHLPDAVPYIEISRQENHPHLIRVYGLRTPDTTLLRIGKYLQRNIHENDAHLSITELEMEKAIYEGAIGSFQVNGV